MKDISDITACVIDHKLFLPLAQRLGEQYKRVLYYTPSERGFPIVNDSVVGDGCDKIERIADFWPLKESIDLFVFPDIQHAGLQIELAEQGIPVWGSRHGDELEINRTKFLETLEGLGLSVPEYTRVKGVSALREFLRDKTDWFVKISKFRGSMETWRWLSYEESSGELDQLAVRFGPIQDEIPFLCLKSIETPLEVGIDTYCIKNRMPRRVLQGYESKDRGYFAHVQDQSEIPEQARTIGEAFANVLGQYDYRNFFSTEIRIKGDKAYFIDPCLRAPSPGLESQLMLYDNLGEIIWRGAHGELVEPECSADYAMQVCLTAKVEPTEWTTLKFPEAIRDNVKCGNACFLNGLACIPPFDPPKEEVGWLGATGDTPQECLDEIKGMMEKLPHNVCAHTDAIASLIQEIETAEEHGIKFGSEPMPEPGEAVET